MAINDVKHALLRHLREVAPDGVDWAVRGGETGLMAWMDSTAVKDVDLWVCGEDLGHFIDALSYSAQGIVSLESDPRWLRHIVFVMKDEFGGQLVDITFGDLKVGGTLTCREELITTADGPFGPVLSGVAAVSDLLMRKLLRGKVPSLERLTEARAHWQSASTRQRDVWLEDLRAIFGVSLARFVLAILNGQSMTHLHRCAFVLSASWISLNSSGAKLFLRRRRRLVLGRQHRVLLKRPVAAVLFHLTGEWSEETAARMITALQGIGAETRCIGINSDRTVRENLEISRQFIVGWLFGHAVILLDTRENPTFSRIQDVAIKWLFGTPLRIPSTELKTIHVSEELLTSQQVASCLIEQYYLAAHRWYIDDSAEALRLSKIVPIERDSSIQENRLNHIL